MARFKLIPVVHLILLRDGHALMLRRHQTGYEDGNYSLIAGHVDGNETFRRTMLRETREEAGLTLAENQLQLALIMHRKAQDERLSLFFTAQNWTGEPGNQELEKCDDMSWFALETLLPNTVPYIAAALASFRSGEH